jgi:NAD(P)-dependent dehydrogenase (short-subunit alcohol dehydrogenase family)
LVTGATSGIGRATALALAGAGVDLVVSGRDAARLESVVDEAAGVGGGEVHGVIADLAARAGVRELADAVGRRWDTLDVLVNNAGVTSAERLITLDGVERTWAVNYLAPFLLTHLLVDVLQAADRPRVVNVASAAQAFGRLDLDDLQFTRRRYRGLAAYAQAKLALVMFTVSLAERRPRLAVTALHPGGANTRLDRDVPPSVLGALVRRMNTSPEAAARTSVHLALSPEAAGLTGVYVVPGTTPRVKAPNRRASDAETRRRLWDLSLQQTGLSTLGSPG